MNEEKLTPKIDDALSSVIDLLGLEKKGEYYTTCKWGKKTEQGLKLSIINNLRDCGVVLVEKNDDSNK